MNRYYYSDAIINFLNTSNNEILGTVASNSEFADELTQKDAWKEEIQILKDTLTNKKGQIFFEYSIPRMGRRIDAVLIIDNVIFVLEFKIGEKKYLASANDQVWDYALDLKNFHETSQDHIIAPVLIATEADYSDLMQNIQSDKDLVYRPIKSNKFDLGRIIDDVLKYSQGEQIDYSNWINGRYSPTPTIIEAAMSLYNFHSVENISRSDATATNLKNTSSSISAIITDAKENNYKAICFVTGVPGAGKTLVGLDIATKHMDSEKRSTSVYLSGNGPLVAILREALTRDKVKREKEQRKKIRKGDVYSEVKLIIQNVHNFRDECLVDLKAPTDHVAIFDEAQRAWDQTQTSNFMKRKKGVVDFKKSEPEFLISCLDRHEDWAVVICLVGGGQEINTGEAGISEWFEAIDRSFPEWKIFVSSKISDKEYAAEDSLTLIRDRKHLTFNDHLHLSVSMRSFRAEHLSSLIKYILDLEIQLAKQTFLAIKNKYPIAITRDLGKAKKWLKDKARGSERYGIVVSSKAYRLKPLAIDVKSKIDPVHWFLEEKDDVRSSYYLEGVATEFDVQGLELDWTCVTWDADFRYAGSDWKYSEFNGANKWRNVNQEVRKQYLKNAYRVLLTRARQGMIILVPHGDVNDSTRDPKYYNSTFEYLKDVGFAVV